MTAQELLAKLGDELNWSDADKVDLICSFADIHDEYWTTPSVPGSSKPPLFASFLEEVADSFRKLLQVDLPAAYGPAKPPPHSSQPQMNEEGDAVYPDEEEDENAPPLASAELLHKPEPKASGPVVHEVVVGLTVHQLRKSEQLLGPEYDPNAENAPEPNQVLVGPIVGPFMSHTASSGKPAEVVVVVAAGRPACFIKASLYLHGKLVKTLPPRYASLVGEYVFDHDGARFKLVLVPPTKRTRS